MASPAVSQVAESATATANTNHTVNRTAAVAAGDLLILIGNKGAAAATTMNSHADWTELLDENQTNGLYIAYRWATGAEAATWTMVTSASVRMAWIMFRITGASNPATQVPQIGTTASGSGTTPNPPSVSVTGGSKDILTIALFGRDGEEADDDTWVTAAPSGFTTLTQKACGVAGTALGGMIAAAEDQATTATSDPATFTVATGAWRAQTIVIHPPPPPKTTATAEVSLASASTPATRTLHAIKLRARKTSLTGTIRAQLYEGGTSRSTELETSELTTSLAEYTLNVADADANGITSYSNLSIRFRGYSAGGDATVFEVAEIWLSIPNAGLTTVSQTLTPSYNVIGRISKTLSPSYSVRVVLQKTLSPSYTVKSAISKTLSPSYTVRAAITKTLSPSYTVKQAISKTLSASYNKRVFLSKTLSASYNVRTVLQKSLASSYNIGAAPSKTLTASYNIRKIVSKTLTASYNVRSAVSKTLTPSYSVRAVLSKTLTASYNLGAAPSKSLTASYNVRSIRTKALAASYNVRSIRTKTLTPSYNVIGRISKALTASYNILAQVQTSVAEVSLASGLIPATRTLHFLKIRARVTTPAHVNSKIRMRLYEGATPRSAELETVSLSTALLTFALPIDDAAAASITDYSNLSIRFYGYSSVGDASTFEIADLWLETPVGTSAVQKSLSPSYNVKVAVSKTLTASYNIISTGAISKSLAASYSVVGRVSKALSASYNILTAGQTTVARISLAPAGRPVPQISHAIHVRARVTGGSGVIRVALYDGATNISGTLSSSTLTGTLAEYVLDISNVNAANITQYQNLEIRFWGFGTGTYEISRLWLETPVGLAWVTKSLTPSYNILLQNVQKSLTASYSVIEFGHIPKSLTVTYAVGGKTRKTLTATPYVIKFGPRGLHNLLVSTNVAPVQKTLTATYGVAGKLLKSLTASYVKRVTVQKTLTASYNITTTSVSVSKNLSVSYTKRVTLSKSLAASYNVLSLSAVLKSLAATYNIRVQLQKSLSASYIKRVTLSKTLTTSYTKKVLVTKTVSASYVINGGIPKSLTPTYNVRARVAKQFTTIYSLGNVTVKSLTSTYTIRSLASKPLVVNYSVVGRLPKTLTANFLLRNIFFKSMTTDYWIHDPREPAPPYQPTGVIVGVNGASSIDITVQKPTGSVIKVP